MEEEKIIRQLIQFHNTCIENAWHTMALLHEHAERMVELFLTQMPDMSPAEKDAINQWITVCREGRQQCVAQRQERYRMIEETFFEET